jgi:cytochrome c biogenesis protein CcdA
MTELLTILTTIALLDSTSILPVATMPLVTMLSSKRPLLTSLSFLSGIFLTYYASALLVYAGLDGLFDVLAVWFDKWMANPDTLDLYLEIALGATMVVSALLMCRPGRKPAQKQQPKSISPVGVFLFGAFLMLIGMPGALPMFAAIDMILRADPSGATAALILLYYVFMFTLPLLAIVVIRVVAGDRSEPVFNAINRFLSVWGRRMVIIVLFALGLALLADGIGWMLGRSFIPID